MVLGAGTPSAQYELPARSAVSASNAAVFRNREMGQRRLLARGESAILHSQLRSKGIGLLQGL